MKLTRMLALMAFSHVIQGQQYHGDPAHPDEEGRKPFVKEEHVDELERLGYAKPIKFREVEDEGAADIPQQRGATILGERPDLVNAISNPGGDSYNNNPTEKELQDLERKRADDLAEQERRAAEGGDGGEGSGDAGGEGQGGEGDGGEGGEDGDKLALAPNIGGTVDLNHDDTTVTIKTLGGGWYEASGLGPDGEPLTQKLRKADAEKMIADFEAAVAAANRDPDEAPRQ